MNKDTREAIKALLSQVEDLLELNFWESGEFPENREEEDTARNATRIVARYLYEEEARAEVKKYGNAEERKHRAQGRRITNRAEWERGILASLMEAYDERQGGN